MLPCRIAAAEQIDKRRQENVHCNVHYLFECFEIYRVELESPSRQA